MKKLFTFTLVLVLMSSINIFAAEDVKYEIYVAGIQVTSDNKDDVLYDGTVRYDAEKNWLIFKGFRTECNGPVLYTKVPLKVRFDEGQTYVKSLDDDAIVAEKDISFVGGQSTYVYGKKHSCVFKGNVSMYCPGRIHLFGEDAPAVDMNGNKLTLKCTNLYAAMHHTGTSPAIVNCGDLELDYCSLNKYSGVYDKDTQKFLYNGEEVTDLAVDPYPWERYDLTIYDKWIDSHNCFDILLDGGSVSYDKATNTLTLKNANIDFAGQFLYTVSMFDINEPNVTIKVIGDNHIKTTKGGIYFGGKGDVNNARITGKGSLDFECEGNVINLWSAKSLLIDGGVTLKAHSRTTYALYAWDESLVVDNAHVEFSTSTEYENTNGALCKELTLKNVNILSNHQFGETKVGYSLEMRFHDPDGKINHETIIIGPDHELPGMFDVNSDGVVNASDVVDIYNYIVSSDNHGITSHDADVNVDNMVNSADVVGIYNYIINGK